MRVHVNFTIDVPAEQLPELRKFMSCETNNDLTFILKGEAEESLLGYLEDNGFRNIKTIRRDGRAI